MANKDTAARNGPELARAVAPDSTPACTKTHSDRNRSRADLAGCVRRTMAPWCHGDTAEMGREGEHLGGGHPYPPPRWRAYCGSGERRRSLARLPLCDGRRSASGCSSKREAEAAVTARKEVPTLKEFAPRFLEGYVEANRTSRAASRRRKPILRLHLVPRSARSPGRDHDRGRAAVESGARQEVRRRP